MNKFRYKIILFILVCMTCLSLCACGMSSQEAEALICEMEYSNIHPFDPAEVSAEVREQIQRSKTFQTAVLSKVNSDMPLRERSYLLACLDSIDYKNESIKAAFDDVLAQYLDSHVYAAHDNNIHSICTYAEVLSLLPEQSYYHPDTAPFVSTVCDLINNDQLTLRMNSGPVENKIRLYGILARDLDQYGFYDETIQAALRSALIEYIMPLTSDNIVQYADVIAEFEDTYYFTLADVFPYNMVKALAEAEGTVLSITDGYYSENQEKYDDGDYLHAPLGVAGKWGDPGVFRKHVTQTPYGDFLYYANEYVDYNFDDEDTYSLTLRWKFADDDHYAQPTILDDEDEIKTFLRIARLGSIYGFDSADRDLIVTVIERNTITFVAANIARPLFSITYD